MKMLEDLAEVMRLIAEYENHTRDDNGCSDHPMAPHGFNRNESHNQDRYVCDCETWQPDAASELAIARALVLYVRTHHATLADMAKRLEAAERDAALLDFLETDAINIVLDGRSHAQMTIGTDRGSIAAAIDATQEGER